MYPEQRHLRPISEWNGLEIPAGLSILWETPDIVSRTIDYFTGYSKLNSASEACNRVLKVWLLLVIMLCFSFFCWCMYAHFLYSLDFKTNSENKFISSKISTALRFLLETLNASEIKVLFSLVELIYISALFKEERLTWPFSENGNRLCELQSKLLKLTPSPLT